VTSADAYSGRKHRFGPRLRGAVCQNDCDHRSGLCGLMAQGTT
jgi:hypothetical protein